MPFPSTHIPRNLYLTPIKDLIINVRGIPITHHPLHVEIIVPGLSDVDLHVRRKLELVEKAYLERDVGSYIWLHARPYRFNALLDARAWADHRSWYESAGDTWVDSEGPGQHAATWREVVFNESAELTMNEDEKEARNRFETGIAYRGASSEEGVRKGLSWTLERDQAVWFAKRYGRKRGWLGQVIVRRHHVTAMFLRRGEREIVLRKIPRGLVLTEIG